MKRFPPEFTGERYWSIRCWKYWRNHRRALQKIGEWGRERDPQRENRGTR